VSFRNTVVGKDSKKYVQALRQPPPGSVFQPPFWVGSLPLSAMSAETSSGSQVAAPPAAQDAAELQLNKYKRLLTLARSSLEANQQALALKDNEINDLQQALQRTGAKKAQEKARRVRGIAEDSSASLDASLVPRNLLCRVDVDPCIWILIEYDEAAQLEAGQYAGKVIDTQWVAFANTQAVDEYIARLPGVPLACPARSLSSHDSSKLEAETSQRIEKVVEEFRRYKVKNEIWRKQKDAETRQLLLHGTQMAASTSAAGSSSATSLSSSLDKALLHTAHAFRDGGQGPGQTTLQELGFLKAKLAENEEAWKTAYERLSKENELLRARGGDMIAAQWRERYDALLKEKEDLADTVHILSGAASTAAGTAPAGTAGGSGGSGRGLLNPYNSTEGSAQTATSSSAPGAYGGRSIEQMYVLLKDEYRDFRRRATAAEQQRLAELEDFRRTVEELTKGSQEAHKTVQSSSSSSSSSSDRDRDNSDRNDASSSSGSSNMLESKNLYIKQMVYQYLLCQEPEVRINIEAALVAMFRYNAEEKTAIGQARQTREGGAGLGMGFGAFGTMFSRT